MNRFDEAEKLTQEDKMKLWHDGKRGFNFKTATPEKLRTNYKICKKLGFKAECKLLSDELKKRGLKIAGKDLDSVKESRNFREGSLYSAESLAEKIDEIATACGDFYFDTYCGGVNAQDPDEIRDELDDYIADVLRSGEFILPTKAFDNEAEWNKFVRAATDAAWECIYFNYDTAKEQVAMNEEYDEEEFNESRRSKRKSLKEGTLTAEDIIEDKALVNSFVKDVRRYYNKIRNKAEDRIGLQASVREYIRNHIDWVLPKTTEFTSSDEYDRAAYLLDEIVEEKLYESQNLRRKNLHERGMTEYGISHADEIYRDNYEREQEKSGDKYIVRPKTQATNRYLTGEFGIHDSYAISFGTLRDLVRTCVKSNDDIELYETSGDYYFKDDGRVWDVLGFVLDEPLNESLVKEFFKQRKMKEYRVDLNGRKEDHISSRKLEDFLKTKGCDFNVVGDGIYEVYIDSKDRYYVEIFTKSGLGSNVYEMRCIRSDAGVTQDLMTKWKGYSFDEFITDLKDAYNAYGDCPLR